MSINFEINKDNIGIATIDMKDHPTNVINKELNTGFEKILSQLTTNDDLEGLIITSGKEDFIVGGDIDLLFKIKDEKEAYDLVEMMKAFLRKLETAGKPVVAAINGTTLGGGLEIALACHHRVAINKPKAKIGLPEVMLGLLPGAGGTQRLPRLIGLQNAASMMMEGKQVSPEEAKELGIIHELAQDKADMMQKAIKWIKANPFPKQPWDEKEFVWPGGAPDSEKAMQIWAVGPSMVNKKAFGNYPAPLHILSCLYEGSRVDFETAQRIESRYFAKCAVSNVSKNMINTLWYQLNDVKKGRYRPQGTPKTQFKKVGIIGAGMMGAGIAYVSAYNGIEVVLKDVSAEAAEKGKDYSRGILEKRVAKGKMTQARAEEILSLIKTTGKPEDFKGCELVVEAVFEQRELKAKVTKEVETYLPKNAVYASNTSTLPITGLAEAYAHPDHFIGLHFFSPVDKMMLVEIIKGKKTSQETIAKAYDYVMQINKYPILVNDSRAFYTSRVFQTYVTEGLALLSEGVNARLIESSSLIAGMPVGPLALADEISFRLMIEIFETTKKDLEAEGKKLEQPKGFDVLYKLSKELGRSGKKAGGGLYEYPPEGKKFLWPKLKELYPPKSKISQRDINDRILFVQALEAARCYQEKVLTNLGDANVGSIFGWGFAPFKGGVLQFINDYGVRDFVVRAHELEKAYGARFNPPEILTKLAEQNKPLT